MWDVFISYAREDKAIARPIAEALSQAGLRVWFDEFVLALGDDLRESIDRGLADSKYGVVILSQAFFAKRWTRRELEGLTAREISSGKTILPVWHDVNHEEIGRFSPALANKLGVPTTEGLNKVIREILRVLRPQPSQGLGGKHLKEEPRRFLPQSKVELIVKQGYRAYEIFWPDQGKAMYVLRAGDRDEADAMELPDDGVLALEQIRVPFGDTTPPVDIVTFQVGNAGKNGRGIVTARIDIQLEFGKGTQHSLELNNVGLSELVMLCDENAQLQRGELEVREGQQSLIRKILLNTTIIRKIIGGKLTADMMGIRVKLQVSIAPEGAGSVSRSLEVFVPLELEQLPHPNWLCIDFGTSAIAAAVGASHYVKLLNLQRVVQSDDPNKRVGRNLEDYDPANLERGTVFLPSYAICDPDRRQGAPVNPHARPGFPLYRPASYKPGDPSFLGLPATSVQLTESPERVIFSLKSWLGQASSDIFLLDDVEVQDVNGAMRTTGRLPLDETVESGFAALLDAYILSQEFRAGQVVVCHPNTFTPFHRERLKRIVCNAVMRRLDIPLEERIRLMSESDAVAYFYCMRRMEEAESLRGTERILVYDCGAGTLDLSVVKIEWDQGTGVYPRSWTVESRLGVPLASNYLDNVFARLIDQTLKEMRGAGTLNPNHFEYTFPVVARNLRGGEEREHRRAIYALWTAIREVKQGLPGKHKPWSGKEPFCVVVSNVFAGGSTVVCPREIKADVLDQYLQSPGADETGLWWRKDLDSQLCLCIPAAKVHSFRPMEAYLRFVTGDVIDETLRVAGLEAKNIDTVVVSGRGALWPGLRELVWQRFPNAAKPDLSGGGTGNLMKEAVVRGAIAWQNVFSGVVQFTEPPSPRLGLLLEGEQKLIPEEEWDPQKPIPLVANSTFRLVQISHRNPNLREDINSLRRYFYIDVEAPRFLRDTYWRDDPNLYISKREVEGKVVISLQSKAGYGYTISTSGSVGQDILRPQWPIGQVLLGPNE